jgi:hypothetical protein
MKYLSLFLFAVLLSISVSAQQWGMYTLYSQSGSAATYLVDTSGTTYKTWTHASDNKTGYGAYLIEGDTLVRAYQYDGTSINGGAISGGLQKVTWDGTIAWDFVYSGSDYVLHHDICPLPNGNVLCICYDKRSSTEVTQAGSSYTDLILSEKIIEVKPTGATTGEIVWEWYVWDHLCQDENSSKDNYVTSIVNNPQLFNVNYGTESSGPPGMDLDWIHMNGIDFNAELDQIVFSSHKWNEIFIIDHSTTTVEAAGHTGGNSGKGGDLLFRWGNPEAYDASGTTNFDVVHDAHWVPSNNPDNPGCLAAINNGGGTGGNAAVDIINPPINGYNYDIILGQAYEPATYTDRFNTAYNSSGQSSSEQLPNGNMLLCIVGSGAVYIHEVNSDGDILWSKTVSGSIPQAHRYEKCFVRPVNATLSASETAIAQGESVTLNTTATAITESSPSFSYNWSSSPVGFTSTDANPSITPDETATYYLTVTNDQSGCSDEVFVTVNVDPVSIESNVIENEFNIYPNPNDGLFLISATDDFSYKIISTDGSEIRSGENDTEIDMSNVQAGIYYIIIKSDVIVKTEKLIIIK